MTSRVPPSSASHVQMMLLSLQRDSDLTWNKPRLLFLKITGNEEPATTPIEIAKTLTRLPYNVRELMLNAIDTKNRTRTDSQIWTIANLWTWSKKSSGENSNEDPAETLQDVIAYLTLVQSEELPGYAETK
ncbi:hypothetical protein TWF173_005464 [Orbilia oligospora]|uniref:Uncharacterized protein n=2 Tax=Orbilia oligospora TaxID=2813651 RepID=G1X336_ARTOA|nr:hypothetical protein AOL_s00043g109 [Orbilia oligospora ATCC 24927]KAF3192412.1 hypothetical protein TWF788_000028 [Orbilia oligospora]EGX52320.1 hypothetical protein AOL_s00043g109 [Orbilia oligospora ATCC 24927]KAF3202203.1 hypothetical protein TWF679_011036 [Orbilia oligospora]KAF3204990.1 hypothetical protein TWF191_001983 [Orbilia oligospora]KAF3224397.1 hypothetical protein TWF106_003864 [Orbilia oligospora]